MIVYHSFKIHQLMKQVLNWQAWWSILRKSLYILVVFPGWKAKLQMLHWI